MQDLDKNQPLSLYFVIDYKDHACDYPSFFCSSQLGAHSERRWTLYGTVCSCRAAMTTGDEENRVVNEERVHCL